MSQPTKVYTGFPRFTAAPTLNPVITVTRLSGVMPAAFHFSVQDSTMPGASIENGADVYPWRDCHWEWDFGDDGQGTMIDPRSGEEVDPSTDQVGPEAAYVYRTPGTYTVTVTGYARSGERTYTTASTSTLRVNQVQRIFIPGSTTGTFRLGWGDEWTDPITITVPSYAVGPPEVIENGSGSMWEVLEALEGLTGLAGNIRSAGTECTSSVLGWYYLIEFCNDLGGQENALIQIDSDDLTSPEIYRKDYIRAHYADSGPPWITATGGTYTISNGSGHAMPAFTTGSLDFNATSAEIQSAINAALNTVNATSGVNYVNVTSRLGVDGGEVVGNETEIPQQTQWWLEWQPPYHNTTYRALTMNRTNWVGREYTWFTNNAYQAPYAFDAEAVEFEAGGTASQITVTNGNMVTRYYDPVDGSDSNDGLSESAPRKTWADMKTWFDGASSSEYRQALWKRGTTVSNNTAWTTPLRFVRVGAYGIGARPILSAAVDVMDHVMATVGSTRGVEYQVQDVVFSDIDYQSAATRMTSSTVSAVANPEMVVSDVMWDNCKFRKDIEMAGHSVARKVTWWECEFDGDSYEGMMIKTALTWNNFTGCTFTGGRYNSVTLHPSGSYLEHPIYPSDGSHFLVRWAHHRYGTLESDLANFVRGTVEEQPGPVYCWYICDSLVEASVTGTSCASGGTLNPWFRNNNLNRGILDACVVSGMWIKAGGGTGRVLPRVSSGSDPKTGGGTYAFGVVNPEMPAELLQRVAQACSFSNCFVGVVRDCRIWAGQLEGRTWELPSMVPGDWRTNGVILVQGPTGFNGAGASASDSFVAIQVYGNDIGNPGIGAIFSWFGGPSIYAADNTFSCLGTKSAVIRCFKDDDPPIIMKRNSIYVEGDSGRSTGAKAWDVDGTERTIAEAAAAGQFDSTNVIGGPAQTWARSFERPAVTGAAQIAQAMTNRMPRQGQRMGGRRRY